MSRRPRARAIGLALVGSLVLAASASAADGPPPPPTAVNGHAVKVLGANVPTPTAFGFLGSTVFVGSGPNEQGDAPGGLFVLSKGQAVRLPDSPPVVFGLVAHKKTLYVSTGPSIIALSHWNGSTFKSKRVVYAGKKGFDGFNGLAWGPDGRIYAGISLNQKFDHKKDHSRYAQSVVSLRPNGKGGLRVVARGLRQPFQLVFPGHAKNPYVTVLSQDQTKQVPPDAIVIAKQGQNYRFPKCNFTKSRACKGVPKPFVKLPKHASPMGIGAIGKTLYVSLFGGRGHGPEVVTISKNRKVKTFLKGFVAPVIALGVHGHTVYAGDLTGRVYAVHS